MITGIAIGKKKPTVSISMGAFITSIDSSPPDALACGGESPITRWDCGTGAAAPRGPGNQTVTILRLMSPRALHSCPGRAACNTRRGKRACHTQRRIRENSKQTTHKDADAVLTPTWPQRVYTPRFRPQCLL
jgi:hypothetical protein